MSKVDYRFEFTDRFIRIFRLTGTMDGHPLLVDQIERPQSRSPHRIMIDFLKRHGQTLLTTTGLSSMKPDGFVATECPD